MTCFETDVWEFLARFYLTVLGIIIFIFPSQDQDSEEINVYFLNFCVQKNKIVTFRSEDDYDTESTFMSLEFQTLILILSHKSLK